MNIFKCDSRCCTLKSIKYKQSKYEFDRVYYSNQKAGVVVYDPASTKILLVQSRGHLWGPPKGTLAFDETYKECAVREVLEETGLIIKPESLVKSALLSTSSQYFYFEMPECEVYVQSHLSENDANGLGWIKLACLAKLVNTGSICLSRHCQLAIKRLLGISFDPPIFTVVNRRKK